MWPQPEATTESHAPVCRGVPTRDLKSASTSARAQDGGDRPEQSRRWPIDRLR